MSTWIGIRALPSLASNHIRMPSYTWSSLILEATIVSAIKTMPSSFGSWVHRSRKTVIIRSMVGSPVPSKSKSRVGRWLSLLQTWNIIAPLTTNCSRYFDRESRYSNRSIANRTSTKSNASLLNLATVINLARTDTEMSRGCLRVMMSLPDMA